MGDRLKGKSAVVTGAGRGIGRAVALGLAAEGANIVVNDYGGSGDGSGSSQAPAEQVVDEIKKNGGRAVPNFDSVTDFNAAARIIRSCVESFGRLDILVNCAGILRDRMLFNMSEQDWDAVVNVHLKGTFNTCRHACVVMKEQNKGRIINFTSDAWLGNAGQGNYSAAKGGIVSLTGGIAREMARYNVTSVAIAPLASTRLTLDDNLKAAIQKKYEAGQITKEQMQKRFSMPGPEFVAPVVVYLATDEASYINGRVIGCGGGRIGLYSNPGESRAIHKDEAGGPWSIDDLVRLVPRTIGVELAK